MLILAGALMGPPAPEDPDLLRHFETRERSESSHVAWHLSLQAAAAGVDLWTTHRCLSAGTCYETNPFSSSEKPPYVAKALTFVVPAALSVWADLTGRDRLAWWITGLAVAVQVGFGIHNLTL